MNLNLPKYDPVDNTEILKLLAEGRHEEVIERNLRYITKCAWKYNNPAMVPDLIQEGTLACVEAIKHFDTTKNVPFLSYLQFWIRKYHLQFLHVYRNQPNHTSLDEVKGECERSVEETLEIPEFNKTSELGQLDDHEKVKHFINSGILSEKEKTVIYNRFLAPETKTLEQLGTEMGMWKTGIKAIEFRALKKLKEALLA